MKNTNAELNQKKLDFLEDTVKYYSEDTTRRSYCEGEGRCYYKLVEGDTVKKCAVGRFLIDKFYLKEVEGKNTKVLFRDLPNALPPILVELGYNFLSYVQNLHDEGSNWSSKGLNRIGEDRVETLKKQIIEGII